MDRNFSRIATRDQSRQDDRTPRDSIARRHDTPPRGNASSRQDVLIKAHNRISPLAQRRRQRGHRIDPVFEPGEVILHRFCPRPPRREIDRTAVIEADRLRLEPSLAASCPITLDGAGEEFGRSDRRGCSARQIPRTAASFLRLCSVRMLMPMAFSSASPCERTRTRGDQVYQRCRRQAAHDHVCESIEFCTPCATTASAQQRRPDRNAVTGQCAGLLRQLERLGSWELPPRHLSREACHMSHCRQCLASSVAIPLRCVGILPFWPQGPP